ncbi:hypothetical protein BB559_001173 [Furculomyces boomerangus]|uniref:Major facilitator superfamily (MFS) profile domain-containing protein n=2 Tax=Harpellales TaxID=61421 RepID=A0A2T9Z2T5_9FUNG|nr:hypothetical protein BB559_001173 [Furculomyces boomerangus]PWA01809.1 hypothetical protein BB558_002051 [Smittium angustum]
MTQSVKPIKAPPQITRIVVIALIIDILAFTSILPLLPRTIEAYQAKENFNNDTLLANILAFMRKVRLFQDTIASSLFLKPIQAPHPTDSTNLHKTDIVLLGGLLGSLYSILQCIVAPLFGRLSDRFGRKPILMFSMIGNLLWTILWMFSSSFELFFLARIIAGISEANIQISTAIIADVSKPKDRAKQMALVGIAFSLGFTIGPMIGAYFGSLGDGHENHSVSPKIPFIGGLKLAPFSNAAVFSLILLTIETIYLYLLLPETKGYMEASSIQTDLIQTSNENEKNKDIPVPTMSKREMYTDSEKTQTTNALHETPFKKICKIYFLYMLIFSGMEYSLTFLMYNLFQYSNKQQGMFLGVIGLISAIIQGGYVRRVVSKIGEKRMVEQGFIGCITGMVITSTMNAIVTILKPLNYKEIVIKSDSGVDSTKKPNPNNFYEQKTGGLLGDFRSSGQLGRAFGPAFACLIYWLFGPVICYGIGALCITFILYSFSKISI